MKRVLVVSYYFPPMTDAGALRGSFLARYLPRFGWQPTILALAFPGERAPGTDGLYAANPLRRTQRRTAPDGSTPGPTGGVVSIARGAYRWIANAQFPDATMGWIAPGYRAAARRMSRESYDAVLSSAYPFSAHVIAHGLARRFNVPWIADYRDLWSGNPYRPESALRRTFTLRFERALLRRAARLTTVSEVLAARLRHVHRRADVIAISNGSSPEEWNDIPLVVPLEFNIMYAGNLYGGLRSPDTLFAATAALRRAGHPAGRDLRFDFYTGEAGVVAASADRFGVRDAVRMHGIIPRADVLTRQREAAGLAILLRDDAALASEFGSKIFEYLGAGRPIIATGPPGSVLADMLSRSGAGHFAADVTTATQALRALHADYQAGCFNVELAADFRPFSAVDLAARFATELDLLTARA